MRARLLAALLIAATVSALPLGRSSAAAGSGPSVPAALAGLERAGQLNEAHYANYRSQYLAARRSLGRLTGTRAAELRGVLANLEAIAAHGQLTASRLPLLFLTLERNRQWWTTGPLLAYGHRVSFPGSLLVWEYYPGQGIELQWLGTFGEANSYYFSKQWSKLRTVLGEALSLVSRRAGGIAWEYMFRFDGGAPPWTSGLSQGTALQALARAGTHLKDPAYLSAAREALGIFRTAPPEGVRIPTSLGTHYLEYSFAPRERILNGFLQAVIGLYDYSQLTGDTLGEQLFEAGDAEARAEVPHYDTGAWSMYDQHSESDLNYHELVTTFLQNLCERTRHGPPLRATGPIAGDQIYCATAQHFHEYMHQKPVISLLSHTLAPGTRAGVRMSLSKVSSVTMTVRRGSSVVWTNTATVERGTPRLLWITPRGGGSYSVTLRAVDLAGNAASTNGEVTVAPPPRKPGAHA